MRMRVLCGLVLLLTVRAVSGQRRYAGFDRNDYPGTAALHELHKSFAFAGYWLNSPPGATQSSWLGHRKELRAAGFGFLVLWDGRLDREIRAAGIASDELGRQDAAAAVVFARREGFPAHTIVFLDQEEGGRLLPEQAAYLFAWTEAIAASEYRPGAYVSGQPVPDGGVGTITTAQDVTQKVAAGHLHPVALWVVQDACPPAPGCVVPPPPLAAGGTPDAVAWQYAQSPRRKQLTDACSATYAPDNQCYGPSNDKLFLDLDVAAVGDPSHGR
jgi:hypothetical protein